MAEMKTLKLGVTKLENYTAINDNFGEVEVQVTALQAKDVELKEGLDGKLGKTEKAESAKNADTVSGFTVGQNVPADAVFMNQEKINELATDVEVAGVKNEVLGKVTEVDTKVDTEVGKISAKVEEKATELNNTITEKNKYTNATPIVQGIGGIKAGETFEGLTVQQMLDKLLYPYVQPVAGITVVPNGGTYEKGSEVTITSLKVNATKKSRNIKQVEAKNGGTSLKVVTEGVANGGSFDCMPESGLKISTNATLTGIVTDTDNKAVSANSGTFTFVDPFYYGTVAAGATPDGKAIKAMTKVVQTKGTKTFKYTTDNSCMVIAYPQSYGDLKSALDPNKFENIASYTKSVVNVACLSGEVAYNVYVKAASTAEGFAITYSF